MKIPLLDHGYIEFIEHWGSDERIIESARMSVDKGFVSWDEYWQCEKCKTYWKKNEHGAWVGVFQEENYGKGNCHPGCDFNNLTHHPGDLKLLRHLYESVPKHTTPFEMAGMVIEIQAPIFVFREWMRHRVFSYNEMSARYTPLPNLNYIPSLERLMMGNDGTNKQAGTIKGAAVLTEDAAKAFQLGLKEMYEHQEEFYQAALVCGIPKELARVDLPVGRYSRMRASTNLLNWTRFLILRMHKKAQWEIRQYADEVGKIIAEKFPRTWELFDKGLNRG